jgi:hypothetical protein
MFAGVCWFTTDSSVMAGRIVCGFLGGSLHEYHNARLENITARQKEPENPQQSGASFGGSRRGSWGTA